MKTLIIGLIFLASNALASPGNSEFSYKPEKVVVSELFILKIDSGLFNWTSTASENFRYRPTLRDHPALPKWISFEFSKERNLGYLYGSPPAKYANKKIDIEIVALNRLTYETRRIIIPFEICSKDPPKNVIQMKIVNLNWVNLTDLGRVENLKGIFKNDLWPESANDLNIIFMESAVKLGARIPLRAQQCEGVIIHLGSNAKLSERLIELSEEIKPLSKLTTCIYKRASVQTIFENAGFKIDWCAFKIAPYDQSTGEDVTNLGEEASRLSQKSWIGLTKDELPERNYSEELALAICIPTVSFAFLVAILTVVICFNHEKLNDEESTNFIDGLFAKCNPVFNKSLESDERKSSQPVQMVQYSAGNSKGQSTTVLKSLHDPYDDNLSLGSQSPTSSVFRDGSPNLNASYMRPQPPAYKGKASLSTADFENGI